jgi:hypothetical protein
VRRMQCGLTRSSDANLRDPGYSLITDASKSSDLVDTSVTGASMPRMRMREVGSNEGVGIKVPRDTVDHQILVTCQ